MTKTLGVLFLHGIGTKKMHDNPKKPYSKDLEKGIIDNFGDGEEGKVVFQEVIYQDILDNYQTTYFDKAMNEGLDDRKTRKLFMKILGDATAYANNQAKIDIDNVTQTLYNSIHKKVDQAVAKLESNLDSGANLVIIAHSLGGLVISNYIYDILENKRGSLPSLDSSFKKLESCQALITFGCNIPLFAMTLDQFNPISLPLSNKGKVPDDPGYLKNRWLNVYDNDDALGWPLLPLADIKCSNIQDALRLSNCQ